ETTAREDARWRSSVSTADASGAEFRHAMRAVGYKEAKSPRAGPLRLARRHRAVALDHAGDARIQRAGRRPSQRGLDERDVGGKVSRLHARLVFRPRDVLDATAAGGG